MNHQNMTKLEIIHYLEQYVLSENVSDKNLMISMLTNKLEGSSSSELCFYDLKDDLKARDSFFKRAVASKYGIVIVPEVSYEAEVANCIVVQRKSFLKVQKILCDVMYPYSADKKIIGVTGTNGKTTTVFLGMQLAALAGKRSLSIGTLGLYDMSGKLPLETGMTSPSYIEIRKILAYCNDTHDQFFFEASSHAIDQERFYEINFDVAAWTSFSQDHLDYHKTMDQYFRAKFGIFSKTKAVFVPWRENELIERININNKFLKQTVPLDVELNNPFWSADYNISNLEIAVSLNQHIGNIVDIKMLNSLLPPPGRFQPVVLKASVGYVDYAHTPDALENILSTLVKAFPDKKIITVFGCGGDRDKTKRPLMGIIAQKYSNLIFVTSDNPRGENPADIIQDIVSEMEINNRVILEPDRLIAIQKAVKELDCEHILLIAGKGHEDYQEIAGVKYKFDDYKILLELSGKSNDK